VLGLQDIAAMPPSVFRGALPRWAASHVDPGIAHVVGERVDAIVLDLPDEVLASLVHGYATLGEAWEAYRAHPAARRMMRALMDAVVPSAEVVGREGLESFLSGGARRRLIACNHLSYVDTQVTDIVLAREGYRDLADRLVAVAGPKVYTDAWRRLAALGLNTRKTVQSAAVATEQNALPPREMAAIARDTVLACEALMDEGYVVLLYPEGTRSRDGRMQPFLRAVGRYLAADGVHVLPLAQTGTETIFPRDAARMVPGAVRLAFGAPLAPSEDRGSGVARAQAAIAELLPPDYAPGPG
jgi:1-acyl-sn-glycerol-3-phosphate acyltransferase